LSSLKGYLYILEGYAMITSEQVKAARGMLRWNQQDLAAASGISLPAIKRLEQLPGPLAAQSRTVEAIIAAFENADVKFLAEDNGGAGVRLKPKKAKRKGK
jgi:predicted transcriptional regulator